MSAIEPNPFIKALLPIIKEVDGQTEDSSAIKQTVSNVALPIIESQPDDKFCLLAGADKQKPRILPTKIGNPLDDKEIYFLLAGTGKQGPAISKKLASTVKNYVKLHGCLPIVELRDAPGGVQRVFLVGGQELSDEQFIAEQFLAGEEVDLSAGARKTFIKNISREDAIELIEAIHVFNKTGDKIIRVSRTWGTCLKFETEKGKSLSLSEIRKYIPQPTLSREIIRTSPDLNPSHGSRDEANKILRLIPRYKELTLHLNSYHRMTGKIPSFGIAENEFDWDLTERLLIDREFVKDFISEVKNIRLSYDKFIKRPNRTPEQNQKEFVAWYHLQKEEARFGNKIEWLLGGQPDSIAALRRAWVSSRK